MKKIQAIIGTIFSRYTPRLSTSTQTVVVRYLPWGVLFITFLSLISVLTLWHSLSAANHYVDIVNGDYRQYQSISTARLDHVSLTAWLGLGFLLLETCTYATAYQGLRRKTAKGWERLFCAFILNLLYGFFIAVSNQGSINSFIGSIIGTSIGLYFMFQIKKRYN